MGCSVTLLDAAAGTSLVVKVPQNRLPESTAMAFQEIGPIWSNGWNGIFYPGCDGEWLLGQLD
jgi:hypothetical protein